MSEANWVASGVSISATESVDVDVAMHNLDDDTDFTVGVSSSNITEGTVSPSTITFTENNWNTPKQSLSQELTIMMQMAIRTITSACQLMVWRRQISACITLTMIQKT